MDRSDARPAWPSLPLEPWRDTLATLQLWSQVVGKIRLARAPWRNHWWHVPLYLTSRGLTTSPMPDGARAFQIDFDFLDHRLRVSTSDGGRAELELRPRSVADLYDELFRRLRGLGIEVAVWTMPQEVEDPIPFERDERHASYDPDAAERFWRALLGAGLALERFQRGWLGKASPVHFFWGSFDLAVTRFSGRRAPEHPGGVPGLADRVVREAYSHEVASFGFWPGGDALPEPVFYAYAYPEPDGFRDAPPGAGGAYYHPELREFVLPYEAVRTAPDPDALLQGFLRAAYEAAARGGWPPELTTSR